MPRFRVDRYPSLPHLGGNHLVLHLSGEVPRRRSTYLRNGTYLDLNNLRPIIVSQPAFTRPQKTIALGPPDYGSYQVPDEDQAHIGVLKGYLDTRTNTIVPAVTEENRSYVQEMTVGYRCDVTCPAGLDRGSLFVESGSLSEHSFVTSVNIHCATERGTRAQVIEVWNSSMPDPSNPSDPRTGPLHRVLLSDFRCPPTSTGEPRYIYRVGMRSGLGSGAFDVIGVRSRVVVRIILPDGKVVFDDYAWHVAGPLTADYVIPLGAAAGKSHFFVELDFPAYDDVLQGAPGGITVDADVVQLTWPKNYAPTTPTGPPPPPRPDDVVGLGNWGRARFA